MWVLAGSLPLRQERAGLEGALARREDILVWWGTPARVGVGWCRGNGTEAWGMWVGLAPGAPRLVGSLSLQTLGEAQWPEGL